MAITITWGTKVINVPKADMLLVQSNPTEIRELNLDTFRLTLKDLEDSEEGIVFPKTHNHNPVVTVSGVQLARVIEILSPYTITFEDGQYAVNLVGANSNVADKVNLNQVSVRSANSAGLVQTREIEYASFQNAVWVDVTNGLAGTDYPQGTPAYPVNNMTDAHFIAGLRGFLKFMLIGTVTIDGGINYTGHIFEGINKLTCTATIASAANVTNCLFQNLTVDGTLDNNAFLNDCVLKDLTFVEGDIHGCEIDGTITLGGTEGLEIFHSYSGRRGAADPSIINMGGGGRNCAIHGFTGHVKITNMSSDGTVGLHGSGRATVDSTVSAGNVHILGSWKVSDNHTGTAVVLQNYNVHPAKIADVVWDEAASGHVTSGSFGEFMQKKLLTVAKFLGLK